MPQAPAWGIEADLGARRCWAPGAWVLEGAALVTEERRGREQVVRPEMRTLRRAARLLDAYEQLWRGRARRIDDLLAEEAPPGGREADPEGTTTCP